jgi:hypothetical protein
MRVTKTDDLSLSPPPGQCTTIGEHVLLWEEEVEEETAAAALALASKAASISCKKRRVESGTSTLGCQDRNCSCVNDRVSFDYVVMCCRKRKEYKGREEKR